MGTASIKGQVTISGKAAANVTVTLDVESLGKGIQGRIFDPRILPIQQARTDADGRFQFLNLPAGTFRLNAGPLLFTPVGDRLSRWKSITLDEGETIENIDLNLNRGGVITGRVTDATGKAVILAQIKIMTPRNSGQEQVDFQEYHLPLSEQGYTDDRGIYRIFGLPRGQYAVTIGQNAQSGMPNPALIGIDPVWYPSATNPKKAKILEIDEGTELTGIDLVLGEESGTYAARGRVIDAETGAMVENVSVSAFSITPDQEIQNTSASSTHTDKEGKFQLTDLPNGTYRLLVNTVEIPGSFYHSGEDFTISDADLESLEVNLRKGATVEGVIVFVGALSQELQARLKSNPNWLQLLSSEDGKEMNSPIPTKVDGIRFQAEGVTPGNLFINYDEQTLHPWHLLRVEQNDAPVLQQIVARAGQKVSGLRLIFSKGTGRIHGEVRFKDGSPFINSRIIVIAYPAGSAGGSNPYMKSGGGTLADQKGRFLFEGLLPGEYEIMVHLMSSRPDHSGNVNYQSNKPEQRVTLQNGGEVTTTIEIDLTKAQPARKQ